VADVWEEEAFVDGDVDSVLVGGRVGGALVGVTKPPKLLGPHAPVLVSKTSDGYACGPNNLTGSVRVPRGPRINDLPPRSQD
jgi:hypothetical protein